MFKLRYDEAGKGVLSNAWLRLNPPRIPLGISLGKFSTIYEGNTPWLPYPKVGKQHMSDTIMFVGTTGSGKSVALKLYAAFIYFGGRPVDYHDAPGRDAPYFHEPNLQPGTLPPYTKPTGLKGYYLFYPSKEGRKRLYFERIVRPNFCKYNETQLESLGFTTGAALYLKRILNDYSPFKSFETLQDFIENFPVNELQSEKILKDLKTKRLRLLHNKQYKVNDFIHRESKNSIKKILPTIMAKGRYYIRVDKKGNRTKVFKRLFRLDSKQDFDYTKAYFEQASVFRSYNDFSLAKIEIHYTMALLEKLRDKHKAVVPPFELIDEAHKIFCGSEEELNIVVNNFVMVCRKIEVGLGLALPDVDNVEPSVLGDFKNFVVGQFTGKSSTTIAVSMGRPEFAFIIRSLKLDRYTGKRTMFFYNKDKKMFDEYVPYDCPCDKNRAK